MRCLKELQVASLDQWFLKRNYPVVLFGRFDDQSLQCGIDPRTSGRMDSDVIDVNSTPDEPAKESSYFHVHGSHL